MENSEVLINPLTKYFHDSYPLQHQNQPGLQADMTPIPDCGEQSYKGCGRLKGRKALITGGDSGIGRAVAIAYAREGADIALNYLLAEKDDAEEVRQLIEDAGQKAVLIPGDIGNEDFCGQMIEKARKELDGLDILVLNGGRQIAVKDILDLSTDQLIRTFEVNVFSMFWIVKAAMPYLKPGTSIITTTSVQAYQPGEMLLDYASTKSAVVAFTKALASQVAAKGIRVNAVAPGPVWTALQITGGQPQEDIPEFGQDTLMARAGQPVELSGVYVLLASEDASYTTAQVYGVTGGMYIN